MSAPRPRTFLSLKANLPSASRTEHNRNLHLSQILHQPLDRVNVLGNEDGSYGHTGCVNALNWSQNGELLLSGGDDTTVRLWRMDSSNTEQEYPFVCRAVISTGHTGNIFNAQLLPYSTRFELVQCFSKHFTYRITVAADKQIRVSDIALALNSNAQDSVETQYSMKQSVQRVLRCHSDRVKRIVTEDSPALFLTVSEDGTVRQHDLRTPHNCRQNTCPMPLLQLSHDLSTVSLSTLTPYHFVVAGEAPYGYLFDRRNVGRRIEDEWGVPSSTNDVTTCVRRFGRPPKTERKKRFPRDHITGSRMSNYNGHEVLLSYSGDATYVFSTLDEPTESSPTSTFASTSGTPEREKRQQNQSKEHSRISMRPNLDAFLRAAELFRERSRDEEVAGEMEDEGEDEGEDESDASKEDEIEEEEAAEMELSYHPGVPTVMPRRRFLGARNVDTVKDVNFLGPDDSLVVSGSDDGNFFIWDKSTANLAGIYEADGSVVNVIEGHPSLPLLAVSGIDTTVKLFAPARGRSSFSRIESVDQILESNKRPPQSFDFRALIAEAMLRTGSSTTNECIHQ